MAIVDISAHFDLVFDVQFDITTVSPIRALMDIHSEVVIRSEAVERYFATYTWPDHRSHRVSLIDRDYAGLATRIHLEGDGFVPEIGNLDKGIFSSIAVSRASLNILDQTGGLRAEFYTIDPERFRVIHYIDGEIYFIGKLLPEQYYRALTHRRTTISLLVTDGLGDLQDVPYHNSRPVNERDISPVMEAIVLILSQVGFEIDIEVSFNWHVYGIDAARILEEVKLNDYVLRPKSMYDVLKSLMLSMTARIYQEAGRWVIEQIELKTEPYIVHRYSYTGAHQESYEFDPVFDGTFAENELRHRPVGGSEAFITGYNRIKLITEIPALLSGRRPVVAPLSFLVPASERPHGFYALIKNYDFRFWTDDATPLFYEKSDGAVISKNADVPSGTVIEEAYSCQIANAATTGHFSTKLYDIPAGMSGGLVLRFYIKRVGSGSTYYFIAIRCGDLYAQWDDEVNGFIWETISAPIANSRFDEGSKGTLSDSDWHDVQISIDKFPVEGGELEIFFMGGFTIFGSYSGLRYAYIRPLITGDPAKIEFRRTDPESVYNRELEVDGLFMIDDLLATPAPKFGRAAEKLHWKRLPYAVDEPPSGFSILDLAAESHLTLQSDKLIVREETYLQREGMLLFISFRNVAAIDGILYMPVYMKKVWRRGIIEGQWVKIGTIAEEPEPYVPPEILPFLYGENGTATFYKINDTDGTEVFRDVVPSRNVTCSDIDDEGNLYIGDLQGYVQKRSVVNGSLIWETQITTETNGVQVIAVTRADRLYAAPYQFGNNARVRCLSIEDGSILWSTSLIVGRIQGSVMECDTEGHVYVATIDPVIPTNTHRLYKLDSGGNIVGTYDSESTVSAERWRSLAYNPMEHAVYAGRSNGTIQIFDADTFALLSTLTVGDSGTNPIRAIAFNKLNYLYAHVTLGTNNTRVRVYNEARAFLWSVQPNISSGMHGIATDQDNNLYRGVDVGGNFGIRKHDVDGNTLWTSPVLLTGQLYVNTIVHHAMRIGVFSDRWGLIRLTSAPRLVFPYPYTDWHPQTITIKCAQRTDAVKYHFQVSTNPAFSSFIFNDEIESNQLELTGRPFGQTIYWRVRIRAFDHQITAWSDTWNFKIAADAESIFNPVTDYMQRFDGDYGVTKDGSNLVSQWDNIAMYQKHSRHAIPAAGNEPLWIANSLNGHAGIQFNNNGKFFTYTPSRDAPNITLLAVMKGNNQTHATSVAMTFDKYLSIAWHLTGTRLLFQTEPPTNNYSPHVVTGIVSGGNIISATRAGSASPSVKINGSAVSQSGTATRWGAPTTFRIGSSTFIGDILQVVAFNRVLSSGEIAEWENYLSKKYNITI